MNFIPFSRVSINRLWSCFPKVALRHIPQRIVYFNDFSRRLFLGGWLKSQKKWRSITWPSLGLVWVKCEGLVKDDTTTDETPPLTHLEMNEAAALTHTSLLRQASGVMADASMQLLQRTMRAILEFSSEYRKQVNSAIDLLEYCTATLSNPEHHDQFWEMLVASRSEMDSLKQQLKDLAILMTYAYTCLESAAMAAFMNGCEFTATSAQQAMDSAKLELERNSQENYALEVQYNSTYAQYIEASQKVAEEKTERSKGEETIESEEENDKDSNEDAEARMD